MINRFVSISILLKYDTKMSVKKEKLRLIRSFSIEEYVCDIGIFDFF